MPLLVLVLLDHVCSTCPAVCVCSTCPAVCFCAAPCCVVLHNCSNWANDMLAFKAVTAGDAGANKKKKFGGMAAKMLPSGSYTFFMDTGATPSGVPTVGIQYAPPALATSSIQACLTACDDDYLCAGVWMTGVISPNQSNGPSSCTLIKGDATNGVFKRSMTKANVARLILPVSS